LGSDNGKIKEGMLCFFLVAVGKMKNITNNKRQNNNGEDDAVERFAL